MGDLHKKHNGRAAAITLLVANILLLIVLVTSQAMGANDPGSAGPCAIARRDVEISGAAARVFYPLAAACGDYTSEPFAAIAFAHGFSMFGLSDGVSENEANGEHLASWGYVVVIPALPDDAEERAGLLTGTLDFLESANKNAGSFLYGKVDTRRLATAGYSLGGATALAVAARDQRVTAVVALDPVYHTGNFGGEGDPIWDPAAEAPKITVPTGILGAPASSCNAEADYADIYPLVGAGHKASYHITDASHCVFSDPGSSFCSWICSGGTAPEMTVTSKKVMSAWFNYYMQLKPEFYEYLFGAQAQAEVDAGSLQIGIETYPRNLSANDWLGAIRLSWDQFQHPILAGYHVYRRLPEEPSFGSPLATTAVTGSYADFTAVPGQEYIYAVRSFDTGGNLHQLSNELRTRLDADTTETIDNYLPIIRGS